MMTLLAVITLTVVITLLAATPLHEKRKSMNNDNKR